MKKVLSILLTVVMLFSIIPLADFSGLSLAPKAEAETYQTGDHIEFGTYPQSLVTDDDLISRLNVTDTEWISYEYYSGNGDNRDGSMASSDYMKYRDVNIDGAWYRAVKCTKYRPTDTGETQSASNSNQDENGFFTDTTYWFKFEPILWRVLDAANGLVMSEIILDTQPYHNYTIKRYHDTIHTRALYGNKNYTFFASNYSKSSIRSWLNNNFYNTAFSLSQKNIISLTRLENKSSYSNYYDAPETDDNIFLLSYWDSLNPSYGFSSTEYDFGDDMAEGNEYARMTYGSDYAKSQGLRVAESYGYVMDGKSPWLLRTPRHSGAAHEVDYMGRVSSSILTSVNYNKGIRPAMYIDLSAFGSTQSEEAYILRHILFAQDTVMPENFGFYNKVWNEENGKRLGWAKTWEVVGDLGELMTFKFDDLEITADFYELFLSDIILKLTEQQAAEFELKAFDLFQEYHGKIKKALKSTAEWEESVTDGSTVDLEIDSILLDPDFECSGNTATVFSTLLGKFYQNHQDTFTEIFAGLDNAAAICEAITDVADIGKAFTEAYKAYTVTMAYQQVSTQFFTVMYQAAERMGNRQYANWFKRALNQYFALATSGDALFEASLQLCKEMTDMAFDRIAKDVVKNLAYQTVADLIGCAAGPVAIAAFTYSATYGLLDKICGLDKRTKAYEIMTYIAPVEQALCALEDDYAAVLIGSQTLESAQNYDYFYNLYKQVNLYLYQAAYDFRSAAWLSKSKKEEMEIFSMCMDQWKRSSCHTGLSAATVRKYSSVCCPVDVYAYDANGETVLEIVNDEILLCDDSITALTFDGKKSIVYPADQNYSIRIVARESGSMDYSVSEIQGDSSVRQIDYYDIPLAEAQTFNGAVPSAFNVAADAYALTTNEAAISCDYDSSESPCVDMHTVTEWTETAAATCAMPGEKRGVCAACGKQVFETLPVSETHGATILKNAADATCQTDGYTGDEVCSVCGETLQTGAIVEKETVAHRWNDGAITVPATCTAAGERTFTCTVCETEKTEPVAPLAHPDEDKDGWCDACGEELYSHTQTDTSGEKCKYCDTVHPNTFMGRITKFFHSILYFFTHLFGNK